MSAISFHCIAQTRERERGESERAERERGRGAREREREERERASEESEEREARERKRQRERHQRARAVTSGRSWLSSDSMLAVLWTGFPRRSSLVSLVQDANDSRSDSLQISKRCVKSFFYGSVRVPH